MENNHRFRSAASAHARRPVQYGRAPHSQSVAQSKHPVNTQHVAGSPVPTAQAKEISLNLHWRMPKLIRTKIVRPTKRSIYHAVKYYLNASKRRRAAILALVGIIVFTTAFPAIESLVQNKAYALSPGENAVLLHTSKSMADLLKLDNRTATYMFNQDYKAATSATDIKGGGAYIKAEIPQDPTQGIKVTDPTNNIDFTVKPKFDLGTGKQDQNRVVYPAFNGGGHLVYTAGGVGVKQEVTLDHHIGDNLKYSYELELGDAYAAKIEQNGAIGIYGSSLPLASATASTDKDKALLKKAQQKAVKDKLLFILPAPTIKESGSGAAVAKAHYELKGNKLNVLVNHLKNASYPLSIDPTITAASGFGGNGLFSFDANIETNVYVDPSNGYFERSPLTGGNLLTWASASSSVVLPHSFGSAIVYAGTLYVIGGTGSTTTTNISNGASSHLIEQSKINSNGTLAGFTDGNYSGLPSGGLSRFQVLTYNGYIYIVDGINGFTTTAAGGTVSNNVYYTRVTSESYGAFTNGAQLKNWSTTTNKPSTAIFDYGATVYNGYMYVAGGLNSSNTAQSSVLYSSILPNGDLGTFNSGTAMPSTRIGMDMQAYNGHLYILGGNVNTSASPTFSATTLYASIASNGSIADSSWKQGTNLVSSDGASNQVLENYGNQLSMIYNGYLYVTGGWGCTVAAPATTSTCSGTAAVASHSQLAQLNADGSLGTFFPNDFQNGGTSTLTRSATPTFGYNGAMYSVGGCSSVNAASISCTTTNLTSSYATVNTIIGDISNNRNPTTLPTALYGQSTVVLNGFLYLIGGCNTSTGSPYDCNGARSTNYVTYYAAIVADGSLGAWTNSTVSTNATSLHFDGQATPLFGSADCAAGGTDQCGLAGSAVVAYNGYIYVIGGTDGSGTGGQTRNLYYQQPNASTGATTTWTTVTNAIPTAVSEAGAVAYNGAIYFIGGCNGAAGIGCAGGSYQTAVLKSTIGAAGAPGAFATTGQLQLPTDGRAAFGIAIYGGYIYLAGGIDNVNAQNSTVLRAKINSSGNIVTVGTGWVATSASMTAPRRRTVATVVNGYMYVVGGHDASANGGTGATYGDVQIGKLDLSPAGTGDIVGQPATPTLFTQSATSTLTPRWNPAIAFGNGFMYVTGGCTAGPPPAGCTTIGTTDESFVVYNANNLGANTWSSQTNIYSTATGGNPNIANRLGAGSVAYNGYLYVAGGCLTYTMATHVCSLASTDVAYAPIGADGTLGVWTAGTALANLYAFNQLVALNGTLYLLTGENSTGVAKSVVRYSVIGSNGAPGTWTDATFSLPITLTKASVVTYANRIYVAGGYDNTSALNQNKVYYSPVLASGGDITSAWTQTTSSFTTARRELSLVTAGAFLYVIGGYDGTNYYADVQVATPSTSTGDVTSWTTVGEIPYKQAGMSAVGSNGYIYLFGGRNGTATTSCTNDVSFASVNGNGTVGDWQQPANTLTTARFGAALGYSNGYFLVSGGHDCTNIASSNVVMQSGQLSEAIHATYTRYVDFGTDATLRQLYVLGTNAQISGTDIDRWKIIVKTATSLNAVSQGWGQKYIQTLTGLTTGPTYGSPITFQALNSSGVDQGASQFWDITFDIDQSQSFNFPDTTQPQITKYDFYFSPGPGKRLRNGKTFVNELQTTLDAHP